VPLLILGIIVWLIIRAGGSLPAGRSGPAKPETAREVLDRRYAAGEINREDYLRMRQDLD
ncbi:SHOCT domain-containing protein, partial [Acidiphilium sp.]|uniref:SHOCT domain-containing protein n=1 Tax=Acidiphilium sp. TaxID=527 RepID=UPI003CFEFD38